MTERIEREIEEILERLDVDPEKGGQPARKPGGRGQDPIPIQRAREQKQQRTSLGTRLNNAFGVHPGITPSQLLFFGAGLMLVGFVLAAFADPLIWVSFAGVVIFTVAFAWSFFRRPGSTVPARGQTETVWRGRTISYGPDPRPSGLGRLRRVFRRKQ